MPPLDVERASFLCLSPPPGRMAGIFGDGAPGLALRALARPLLSGETVVVVDGGNRFDPYAIGRAAAAHGWASAAAGRDAPVFGAAAAALGGDGRAALSRIHVSRAFTCHQLETLLARELPGALARYGAPLALVLGLPETFADPDVPYPEACRIFRRCLSALRRVVRGGTRVVLVGRAEPAKEGSFHAPLGTPENRAGFFRHVLRAVDPALLLRRDGDTWTWELRSPGSENPTGRASNGGFELRAGADEQEEKPPWRAAAAGEAGRSGSTGGATRNGPGAAAHRPGVIASADEAE